MKSFNKFLFFYFRVESFIEHQDNCSVRNVHHEPPPPPQTAAIITACSSRTASTASTPSSETNYGGAVTVATPLPQEGRPIHIRSSSLTPLVLNNSSNLNLELQLLPLTPNLNPNQEYQQHKVKEPSLHHHHHNHDTTNLNLSIAPSSSSYHHYNNFDRIKELMASEQIMKEKAYAEEAKREAKIQREIAENEFANAKKIRQQAQTELKRAKLLKEQSMKKISSTIMQVTCQTCKGQFQATEETSLVVSYMSSANTDGEGS